MNSTADTPTTNEPPREPQSPPAVFTLYIETPGEFTPSLCLCAPLRYILARALGHNLFETPSALPCPNGVHLLIKAHNAELAHTIIMAELTSLGYLTIAHLGRLKGDGWQCLHGDPDKVWDVVEIMSAHAAALHADINTRTAHAHALYKPLA